MNEKNKNLLIRGGTVVSDSAVIPMDLYIEAGRIKAQGQPGSFDKERVDEVIDASNMYVLPGLVDPHVHFSSPFMGCVTIHDFATGSVTAAFGIALLIDKLIRRKGIASLLILLVGVALGVSGGWQNKKAINTETVLVTQSDLEALEWIKTHTPEDARFFVNTTGWGYGVYRGVDGGGWILPITGRWSLAPTIFYPFGEDLLINETWIDWSFRASRVNACDVDFWELVQEAQLNYLYMRQGTTGIQAQNLVTCDGIHKLYDNEEVSIWLIDSYNSDVGSDEIENSR